MKISLDNGQVTETAGAKNERALMAGLQTCSILRDLPEDILATLAARTHQKQVEDGEVLCHQNDVAHSLWLVMDGWVKLTRETLDGGEAVWDVLGAGHVVGLEALMEPHCYTTQARAVGEVSVLVIPHNILRQMAEIQPKLMVRLLTYTLRQQQEERLELEHRTQQTAPQRIGCFLLKLAGTPSKGAARLHLPFDKGLLAARLGMQPETFSRALAKLKQETDLQMDGVQMLIPDVKQLEAYTCGGCSGIYPCTEN